MKLLKSNLKLIIGFLIGVVITGGIVLVNNVKDALDDLYNN